MWEIRLFQEQRLAWEQERDELQSEISQLKQSQSLAGTGGGAQPNNCDELLKTIEEMKLAEQNRRLAWKAEMQKIETDLNEKQELEDRVEQLRTELRGAHMEIHRLKRPNERTNDQSLRDILSFFLTHVQDPLKKIRIACGDSAGFNFQVRLDPVGAADRDYTAQLVKVVEALRASAKTLDQHHASRFADSLSQSVPEFRCADSVGQSVPRFQRADFLSQSVPGSQFEVKSRSMFDDRVDPLSFSVPGWQVKTMTANPHSGYVPAVDMKAGSDCKGNIFDKFLDQTAEHMSEWFLSKLEPNVH